MNFFRKKTRKYPKPESNLIVSPFWKKTLVFTNGGGGQLFAGIFSRDLQLFFFYLKNCRFSQGVITLWFRVCFNSLRLRGKHTEKLETRLSLMNKIKKYEPRFIYRAPRQLFENIRVSYLVQYHWCKKFLIAQHCRTENSLIDIPVPVWGTFLRPEMF